MIKVPSIGLINIVSGRQIVPELIQKEVTGEMIFERCLPFLTNSLYLASVRKELVRVKGILGSPGASKRAAEIIIDIIRKREQQLSKNQ